MKRYLHVLKRNIDSVLREISIIQTSNGTFYDVCVMPYRGKTLDPEKYVTIRIG